jgi:hypothetical protein
MERTRAIDSKSPKEKIIYMEQNRFKAKNDAIG